MNKESLKEYLSSRYQGWNSFLSNVIFPIFGENDFEDGFETELLESQPERRQLAEATGIRSIKQVGMMYVGVEPLQIFDVTVSDRVMMERNRVNIQRLIRAVMDQFSCAFMLFHYEDDTRWDWRFTYCRKSGNKEETTDSKRYTFLLGPGQSCRTATDNFMALYDKRDSLEIKDIEDAFNVEALSKEFFGKYKAQYEAFVNYMVDPANGMRQDFIDTDFDHTGMKADKIRDREEKPIRDYVKKLLGRIVFLHFLQKKGWLGVPAGKEWGEGDRDFMLNIFKNATERQKENFLDDILEDLFEEGLDRNRSDRGDLYDTKVEGFRNCRIPYLNGGLFERDNLDKKPSHFPASYFDGLLTMLSQYNFTIDENDPNDAEVGVDPEMLGRIFENLLEDNKDKGAFYTPKEIVQYMCRESLIAYLQTDQREEDKNCIRQFVTTHDAALLGDLKEDIDQKLCDVKICDPAIGSGAFPMGLLRELFFCRSAIEPNIVENAANIKRHIIQNNIYGVDIERGAVDIARLRFWLSLIVDEKSPEALPNLDFKIMQGNSLLEQYKGADLSTMTEKKVGAGQGVTIFDSMLDVYRKNLRDKLAEYYACPEHDKKAQLRKDIADIVKQELDEQGIRIDFEDMDLSANSQFFLWHTWFHDVFSRPSKEGFDIVIGNPPYLESRSSNFSESLKVSLQSEIKKRRLSDAGAFPRGADLLIFFYELSLRLLNKKGYNVFITENSWLSTDYGKLFQNFLLKKCEVHAIIDSEYKYFETADINTIITIIRNRNENNDNLPVKFFHCDGSLEKYPCNTFAIHDTEKITLKSFLSSDQLLHNYKWGVIIRAEQKLLRIIEAISQLEDKSLASKISIGQGLNLTKNHTVYSQSSRTYPYYTSEIGPTYSWSNSFCYVSKDDISGSRKKPLLIMSRGIGTHFCSINECSGYTSSYVEVYGDLSQEETLNIWLFCNSSLFWLLREITGRTNLGGGMLKAEATDLKSIPICYKFNRSSEILALYMAVKDKVLDTSISITLNDNQHKMIDAIVLNYFGLDKEELYIVSTLQDMVFRRMKKSKTK